ncbi:MAG TPA: Gfo/Idh/MocA family oxidoreductase, partial [Acidimicrobiales bacterium]|nr:Gfo/Idh/MocA family oxidoreductase [Acidimicrobiales bacterium]
LFKYNEDADFSTSDGDRSPTGATASANRTAAVASRREPLPTGTAVRIGFIGAGNYASSMLLPHLAGRPDVELMRVATRRSLSAANAKRKFTFTEAGTDTDAVLQDAAIDVVFIVTRHSSHASLACRALEAGKAVFVEKPLALTSDELDQILATVDATGNDRIMVGFNRRFSPMLQDMRKRFGRSTEPVIARYFVNAGPLAADSWYRNEELEGSRFVGEGGHFIDTLSWWTGAEPVEVSALATDERDNLQVSIRYGDGSLGTVTYFANGHPRFPKETFEAVCGGRVARLDNFKRATVWSGRHRKVSRSLSAPDKGQRAQIEAFLEAVRTGGPMPISLPSLVATTRATLAVEASLTNQAPQRV